MHGSKQEQWFAYTTEVVLEYSKADIYINLKGLINIIDFFSDVRHQLINYSFNGIHRHSTMN